MNLKLSFHSVVAILYLLDSTVLHLLSVENQICNSCLRKFKGFCQSYIVNRIL